MTVDVSFSLDLTICSDHNAGDKSLVILKTLKILGHACNKLAFINRYDRTAMMCPTFWGWVQSM